MRDPFTSLKRLSLGAALGVLFGMFGFGQPADAANPPPRPGPGPTRSPDGKRAAQPAGNVINVSDLLPPAPEGDPWPLPDAAERLRYHTEQADLAEKQKQHFAAAFHVGRLLLDDPENADLKKHREQALQAHEAK